MEQNNFNKIKRNFDLNTFIKAYRKHLKQDRVPIIIGESATAVSALVVCSFFSAATHPAEYNLFDSSHALFRALFRSDTIASALVVFITANVGFFIYLMFNGSFMKSEGRKMLDSGTYGTSRLYENEKQYNLLNKDGTKNPDGFLEVVDYTCETKNIIVGKALDTGRIVAIPINGVGNRNFWVCGSQGTGKSRYLMRMMIIQHMLRGASMVIIDPKSELLADSYIDLIQHGYKVYVWNLQNHWNSNAWDMVGEFKNESSISMMCQTIINNTGNGVGDFFDNIELVLLKSLCLYVYEVNPVGQKNIGEAYAMLSKPADELNQMFETLRKNNPYSRAAMTYVPFANSQTNQANAILGLQSRMEIWQSDVIKKITSYDEIQLESLAEEKTVIFNVISDSNSTYSVLNATIINMMFNRIYEYANSRPSQKCKVPVEFILDEFPNVGYIVDYKQKLATARSRDIGISMALQNIPQIMNRYPNNEWEELMGGCDNNIFLGCNDPTTSEMYAKLLGKGTQEVGTTHEAPSVGIFGGSVITSTSSGEGQTDLLLEDEIRRLKNKYNGKDVLLLVVNGRNPVVLEKISFDQNIEALRMKSISATELIPDWRISPTGEDICKESAIRINGKLKRSSELVGEIISGENMYLPTGDDDEVRTRIVVEDTAKYGPTRSNLLKIAKEASNKYRNEGKYPNGQPLIETTESDSFLRGIIGDGNDNEAVTPASTAPTAPQPKKKKAHLFDDVLKGNNVYEDEKEDIPTANIPTDEEEPVVNAEEELTQDVADDYIPTEPEQMDAETPFDNEDIPYFDEVADEVDENIAVVDGNEKVEEEVAAPPALDEEPPEVDFWGNPIESFETQKSDKTPASAPKTQNSNKNPYTIKNQSGESKKKITRNEPIDSKTLLRNVLK